LNGLSDADAVGNVKVLPSSAGTQVWGMRPLGKKYTTKRCGGVATCERAGLAAKNSNDGSATSAPAPPKNQRRDS